MSRLIDADELKRQALFGITNDGIGMHVVTVDQIDEQPTIEAEPVRHGHWEQYLPEYHDMFKCSACKVLVRLPFKATKCPYQYCVGCGARMDEVSE